MDAHICFIIDIQHGINQDIKKNHKAFWNNLGNIQSLELYNITIRNIITKHLNTG